MNHIIIFDNLNNCHEIYAHDDWADNLVKSPSFFQGDLNSITSYIDKCISNTSDQIDSYLKINLNTPSEFAKISLPNAQTRHFYLIDVPSRKILSLRPHTHLEIIFGYNYCSLALDGNIEKIKDYKILIDTGIFALSSEEGDGDARNYTQKKLLESINNYLSNPGLPISLEGFSRTTYILINAALSRWTIDYDLDPFSIKMNEKIVSFINDKNLTLTPAHQAQWLEFLQEEGRNTQRSESKALEIKSITNLFEAINQKQSLELGIVRPTHKKTITKL